MILGEDHTKQLISNSPRPHIFYALKKYTKTHGAHFINSNKMCNKILTCNVNMLSKSHFSYIKASQSIAEAC